MKIIFSLNHFLPDRIAGIEVYTFHLARALQQSGADVKLLIPSSQETTGTYKYEGLTVLQYKESTVHSRALVMGKEAPDGLKAFIEIMRREQPDFWHVQELTSGSGIGKYHVDTVAAMGIPILLTMHLSTYSCETGNLVYKEQLLCDGIIREQRCAACVYQARGIAGNKARLLEFASGVLYKSGIKTSSFNSTVGTALAFPFLIRKKRHDLLQLADHCSRIVVLTEFYKEILKNNGVARDKLFLCPQAVAATQPIRNKELFSYPVKLVFVGRVSKYKGVHLLLEAMKSLPANQVSLHIYGPVTEDDYGKECTRFSEGMKHVQWKGSIDPGAVIQTLSSYDVLCLPSTFSEMSPLVIQEAFAAGIPVLASNVYGNAEQVSDGVNGWLFTFKSVDALRDKLQMLIDHPELIDEARKHLPATRSFEMVASEHIALYETILDEKKKSKAFA